MTDFKSLNTGLLANYIHFHDASLMRAFLEKAHSMNIPAYVIHDCFRVPMHFADKVYEFIYAVYAEKVDSNFLSQDFIANNPEIIDIVNRLKAKYQMRDLHHRI